MNKESFAYSPCTFYSKKPSPGDRLQFIYFSSESAAKEYILLNTPVLSVNEVLKLDADIHVGAISKNTPYNDGDQIIIFNEKELKAFAKSKIDKP